MKTKFLLSLFLALLALPVVAATDDFTADGNITVESVTFGETTADLLILSGSTAESFNYDAGAFTVTNPGTFQVGSSDATVKTIRLTQGATTVACAVNAMPGTSYATAPTTAGTYTISPSALTTCQDQCAAVANAATLNDYPTCGAATCDSGYSLTGTGASATCVAIPATVGGSTAARRAQVANPQSAAPAAPSPALAPTVIPGPGPRATFTRSLVAGLTGPDVQALQRWLNQDPATQVAASGAGAPGTETDYFGPATRAAVIRFQLKHGILPSADHPSAGVVGPATQAKLAELYESAPTTPASSPAAEASHAALLSRYLQLLNQYSELLRASQNQ
jgi:hypothetical protein